MGIPVLTLSCAGTPIEAAAVVPLEVEIRRMLDRIPSALLILEDGDLAKGEFALANRKDLAPGSPVSIALRYEGESGAKGKDTVLFDGLVVRNAVEASPQGTRVRIELKDAAFKLARARHSAVFRDQKDGAAIGKLLKDAGLKAGTVEDGTVEHKELVQYHATDWDFILSRAQVLGLVVDAHLGKVSVVKPKLGDKEGRSLKPGMDDVREIELELDGSEQWGEVAGIGWDLAAQKACDPAQATDPGTAPGDLKPKDIAGALGGDSCTLLHPVALEQSELKAWADARLLHSRLTLLRGRVLVDGDPAIAPLDTVTVSRIGSHFDGQALVGGVVHRLDEAGWTTELLLGLPTERFALRTDIAEVPAGGLLPPVTGLQIAKVAAFEKDPKGEHRIKLKLPTLDAKQGAVWARWARPDAGKDRGFLFWPEPDDEVVVGFLNGDPRQPVVLGALHGSKLAPPQAVGGPSDKNPKRAIVSRKGAFVSFDDDKVKIEIKTPGGQRILLDDDAKKVLIEDQHGNRVTLSDQGISIKSAKALNIEASGKVVVKGSAVDVQ